MPRNKRPIDMTGQVFGRLEVLRIGPPGKGRGSKSWYCRCICGTEVLVFRKRLLSGKKKSCGCLAGERSPDLSGKRFGNWTVLREDTNRSERSANRRWFCKCVCGIERSVNGANLVFKNSRGCGCKRHARYTQPNKKRAYSSLVTQISSNYRRGAESRGYVWELNHDQVTVLISSNCSYCGAPPSMRLASYQQFQYNGIDRVNNEFGYTLSNVTACCSRCNHAKYTMSADEFISWICRVYEHIAAQMKAVA